MKRTACLNVSPETRDALNIIRIRHGYSSIDELLKKRFRLSNIGDNN